MGPDETSMEITKLLMTKLVTAIDSMPTSKAMLHGGIGQIPAGTPAPSGAWRCATRTVNRVAVAALSRGEGKPHKQHTHVY